MTTVFWKINYDSGNAVTAATVTTNCACHTC